MTPTHVPPVLVTGGPGRVGSAVVDLLVDAGVPVRVLTRRPEATATLPANVEVVPGDLTPPQPLDAGLPIVSPPTRAGSCFCHHRTSPRTPSSSSQTRWRCSTRILSGSSRRPGS